MRVNVLQSDLHGSTVPLHDRRQSYFTPYKVRSLDTDTRLEKSSIDGGQLCLGASRGDEIPNQSCGISRTAEFGELMTRQTGNYTMACLVVLNTVQSFNHTTFNSKGMVTLAALWSVLNGEHRFP